MSSKIPHPATGEPFDPNESAKPGEAFPKWVKPHDTHIARQGNPEVISVAGFQHHVDRAGGVTVLVADEDGEKLVTAPKGGASKSSRKESE